MKALLLVVTAMILIGTSAEETNRGPPSGDENPDDNCLLPAEGTNRGPSSGDENPDDDCLLPAEETNRTPLSGDKKPDDICLSLFCLLQNCDCLDDIHPVRNLALVNKQFLQETIQFHVPEFVFGIITSKERMSQSYFVGLFLSLVKICKEHPDIALDRLKVRLSKEKAPLFLYRLLSIAEEHLDEIEVLFNVIVKIESVAELMPGWVTVVSEYSRVDDIVVGVKEMWRKLVNKLEVEVDLIGLIQDIPKTFLELIEKDIDEIVMNDEDESSGIDQTLGGRLPLPFAKIPAFLFDVVRETISKNHYGMIKSQPTLARNLFFLGVPIYLDWLKISEFKEDQLAALLPFATNVGYALRDQVEGLIKSGHSNLVYTILKSEAFFSSNFFEFGNGESMGLCFENIISVLITEGQHDLIRLLKQLPLPHDWVVKLEETVNVSILKLAEEETNCLAVEVLSKDAKAKGVAKNRSYGDCFSFSPLPPFKRQCTTVNRAQECKWCHIGECEKAARYHGLCFEHRPRIR